VTKKKKKFDMYISERPFIVYIKINSKYVKLQVEEATKRLNKWGGQEGTTLKN
jgi:hypothetical protein